MKVYQGKSVFGGIVIGRIRVYQKREQQVKYIRAVDSHAQLQRFQKAKEQTLEELSELYGKAASEAGESSAAIFDIHRMMLEDRDYLDSIEDIIMNQSANAEFAISVASDKLFYMFSEMDDEYMQARAADIRDISERLLAVLSGKRSGQFGLEEPVILVAEDLSPSETVQFDKQKVLSFVTVRGSVNSHTAILAKTIGIPSLVGAGLCSDLTALDGKLAIVDGNEGYLYVEPDEETLARMKVILEKQHEKKVSLQALKGKESVTLDGKRVLLCANIGGTDNLEQVHDNDAEGIGLFRSEFLYLEKNGYPTEEEQFAAYKKVVESMAGRRVVIRTLDMGADKQASYMGLTEEENPAMGLRAIRMCLTHPVIFKTQLRALFRASAYGRLAVLYPMITSVWEVKRIQAIIEEVKEELVKERIPFGEVEQGVMIETPAAVMISDLLAAEVDFFSIGTNDLTQYALAVDRQNQKLDAFYDAHHVGTLRMINQIVQNAKKAGIRCCICGELAADQELTALFLAMGIEELSVTPSNVLAMRKLIRETDVEACRADVFQKWLKW